MHDDLKIITVRGAELLPYLSDVARLRIEIFRDFPYLYDGDLAYEEKYLQSYAECSESILVIVFDQQKVVGVSTGMPLRFCINDFKEPFIDNKYDADDIFYLGESVLQHRYRSRGIYRNYFHQRELVARAGKYGIAAFCAVERSLHHSKKPENYMPLDDFWHQLGYQKHAELRTNISWKDVDDDEESHKPMIFWLKNLWK